MATASAWPSASLARHKSRRPRRAKVAQRMAVFPLPGKGSSELPAPLQFAQFGAHTLGGTGPGSGSGGARWSKLRHPSGERGPAYGRVIAVLTSS